MFQETFAQPSTPSRAPWIIGALVVFAVVVAAIAGTVYLRRLNQPEPQPMPVAGWEQLKKRVEDGISSQGRKMPKEEMLAQRQPFACRMVWKNNNDLITTTYIVFDNATVYYRVDTATAINETWYTGWQYNRKKYINSGELNEKVNWVSLGESVGGEENFEVRLKGLHPSDTVYTCTSIQKSDVPTAPPDNISFTNTTDRMTGIR